jgi:hypothetical protein
MRAVSGVSAPIFGAEKGLKATPVTALLSSRLTGLNASPRASGGAPRVLAPAPVGRLPDRVPMATRGIGPRFISIDLQGQVILRHRHSKCRAKTLAFDGVIKSSTNVSTGEPRAGFWRAFFKRLASDRDDDHMKIGAAISARTNIAPGRKKGRRANHRSITWRTTRLQIDPR